MKVSIESPKRKFTRHIERELNSRILVSGKYGTGKSYFLRSLFENLDSYNTFLLSPVNYVVGANEDIFEWIKIDIGKQLLVRYFYDLFPKTDIPKNLLIQNYVYSNANKIFNKLIEEIMTHAVALRKIPLAKAFVAQVEDYQEYEKTAKAELESHASILDNYIRTSINTKGSIFEDDLITQIIRVSLEIVKSKSERKNILILDDLDRLDPEHIFRILNILSAHNDHFDNNKFGFDKVILVCDLDNIHDLYRHKYGSADFEGYIEKFYTYEPFNFSINDAIVSYCEKELELIDISPPSRTLCSLLLTLFFNHKKLRIRNLKKISPPKSLLEFSLPVNTYPRPQPSQHPLLDGKHIDFRSTFIKSDTIEVDYNQFDILKVIHLLSVAFGGMEILAKSINELRRTVVERNTFSTDHLEDVYSSLCIISHISTKIDSNAFCTWNIIGGIDSFASVEMSYPVIEFFGSKFRLPLFWNMAEPYVKGDYFLKCNPLAGLKNYRSEEEKSKVCNYSYLLDEISQIIDFLLRKGMLD